MASPSVPPPTPDSAATLQALDALLNEFFSPSTRNERKREIETLLNDFGAQKDSWRMGFYFLANSTNEYVMMYSMTVVENVINKRWQGNPIHVFRNYTFFYKNVTFFFKYKVVSSS